MALTTKEIAEPVSKRHLTGGNIDLFATCLQGVQFTWASSQFFLCIFRAEIKKTLWVRLLLFQVSRTFRCYINTVDCVTAFSFRVE